MMIYSDYDRYPAIHVRTDGGVHAWQGWDAIGGELTGKLAGKGRQVICVDCYHGVWERDVLDALTARLHPDHVFLAGQAALDKAQVDQMLAYHVTDDRVFGILSHHRIEQFFDAEKRTALRREIEAAQGVVLVFGVGSALLCQPDVLVYADMARWEIQLRFRSGKLANWLSDNYNEEILRKYKRAFFIDWRVLDRHKMTLHDSIDYILDTNTADQPKMMTGDIYRAGLAQAVGQPFRVTPYFDPGVWGGQWMKAVCGLDPDKPNYAWSFDGVPEENSLLMDVDGMVLETPAINLVLTRPRELLGDKVHARFGAEFPIRFDFLDTMGGGNLSLQVHPLTDYIHRKFGMAYTQDESYYILDTGEGGGVYLGLKEGIDAAAMVEELEEAQLGEKAFDTEKYVNFFPAQKHDHFLIPAGTIHCSSKNCMVLEVSATPYIFTFKLWDWGRVGLDGRPRPIHIADGKKVLQFNRTTSWVKENLLNRFQELERGEGYSVVKTGLHELEFIETRVYTVETKASLGWDGEMAMCNLVDGRAAIIESEDGLFDPYLLHYAETVVLPARAGRCLIRPEKPGESIKLLKANIR